MSNELFKSLPSLFVSAENQDVHQTNVLHPIHAAFIVPKLENKPQNPIIDSLDFHSTRMTRAVPTTGMVNRSTKPAIPNDYESGPHKSKMNRLDDGGGGDNIWMIAASGSDAQGNKLKTWDGLRSTYSQDATEGDLLSEQHPSVFTAAQEFVIPHIQAPRTSRSYFQPAALLDILMTNLIGHSSRLYEWDKATEKFQPSVSHMSKVIIAHGFSEELSKDIIRRHLGIGACFRRIDTFIMRARLTRLDSTVHAFLHSLEMIVASLRKQLQRARPHAKTVYSQLWLQYADVEESLIALTELCKVGVTSIPPYETLPGKAPVFLSYVYTFVELHFRSGSPKPLRSALAYLLSTSSSPFFRAIEHSVGIGKSKTADSHTQSGLQDEEVGFREAAALNTYGSPEDYPAFFSDDQKAQTIVAARGLKVLASAAPDHPLLSEYADRRCEWVWHEDQIERIHTGVSSRPFDELRPGTLLGQTTVDGNDQNQQAVNYHPDLASFKTFDMEPGSSLGTRSASLPIDTTPYQTFLATFPEGLPSSAPTLAHMADAVLHPLRVQSNRLTNALLSLFLAPPLSLLSHLFLLRSFSLLASQAFTFRLRGALFSDSYGYQPIGRGTRARTRARLGIKDARDLEAEAEEIAGSQGTASAAKWGIGLGLGLSERGIWPPGGAELGFALRRVIVDSLDEMKIEDTGDIPRLSHEPFEMVRPCEQVIREAEWRLGFAIRDLPVNEGREEWLNPSSIAALDFLYLDYKPSLPVGALITPDILSKYQRIFNFLLRLLRVETVSRGLFKSVIKDSDLFTGYPEALGLLHRFRFHSHAFVSTLITYIFDTAIGIQFDGFMSKVQDIAAQHAMRTSQSILDETGEEPAKMENLGARQAYVDDDTKPVADVFEIMADHSVILDKILGSCVLKTPQRAISDVLEDILTLILRLGGLVRDLRRRALTNEDAAAQLGKLHYNFERKMITFTKVLRAMDDKSELRSLLSALATSDRDYEVLSRNAGGQKREIGLSDLLVRLDPGEWWKQETERRATAKKERQAQSPVS